MPRTPLRSLRSRATFWMAVFLLGIAIAIRFVNYYVTRDILVRDIDTQLWTRLGALKTQQRFAPETLLEPDLRLGGLFLSDIRTASDQQPSLAMRLLMPSEVSRRRFPWFAGVWRSDGSPLDSLRLPDGFSWQPQWRDRTETIWTTPEGDFRLASCRGSDDTLLLVGTPLDQLRQALRDVPRTTEELEQTVEYCRGLALRIQKLSESLLSLSKAESAGDEALAEIDLEPIVEEAAAQVEDVAQARRVTLQVDARSAVVVGSADLLHQVFVKLLANAIEYSPTGGTVEIATAHAGDHWMVRVSDHGRGIPAEKADRVFERFFREDESRVTATGGHGLGLAICRSIMQSHRGTIVYRPTPGGGATFEVHFAAAGPPPP